MEYFCNATISPTQLSVEGEEGIWLIVASFSRAIRGDDDGKVFGVKVKPSCTSPGAEIIRLSSK